MFWEQNQHEGVIAVRAALQVYASRAHLATPERMAELLERGHALLAMMETRLARHDWIATEAATVADLSLYAYTHSAGTKGGFDLTPLPRHPGLVRPDRGPARLRRAGRHPGVTELFAYTDGACSGNPGPGGWGVLLVARDGDRVVKERELSGGEAETTNNRMELLAAIHALEALERPARLTIVTDSVYVRNGILDWLAGWKRNGWRTAAKKPVKNEDLWRRLDDAHARHEVTWEWVKGHAGHPENERADELARAGMAPFKPGKRRAG